MPDVVPYFEGRYIQETFEAFSHIRTQMMGTEMVPETSVSSFNQLTRLIAREDFIKLQVFKTMYTRECFTQK
jgi:hypothetical protein